MGKFFKPLRRKVGVLTLLIACLFAAGWVRSLSTSDAILIPLTKSEFIRLDSRSGRFSWNKVYNAQVTIPKIIWRADAIVPTDEDVVFDHSHYIYEWRWQWGTIDAGRVHSPGDGRVRAKYVILPYWFITIPLALISAFLLLSKPCISNEKIITEPTANEVV